MALWDDDFDPASYTPAPTQNLNVTAIGSVVSPRELEREMPSTSAANRTVVVGREMVRAILHGQDRRLLVVVGPCSVHDVDAAAEYCRRLVALRPRVEHALMLVMRVYFEKPRTTVGWKGLLNDPHLDGTFDINHGLRLARRLLLDVNEMGMPSATELLEPITPQYIDEFVTWAAIGARTTESQTHRQMASGLSMPVGYKNSTDGNLQIAIDAFKSAQHAHHFLGIDDDGRVAVVKTRGNPDGHVILRGGAGKTNYDPATVRQCAEMLQKASLPAKVMIDCSHANAAKKHENQGKVFADAIDQLRADPHSPIMGLMLESNLASGRQDIPADRRDLKHGVSVTDACIGWDETEQLLLDAAARLRT